MIQVWLVRRLALATTAMMFSVSAVTQAQQSASAEAMVALEKARKAREDALQALGEADKALKAAEALLGAQAVRAGNETGVPASAAQLEATRVPVVAATGDRASASVILCDGYTEAEIAERILTAAATGEPASKDGLNWFTQQCLGLTKWRQYDTKSLNLGATAASSDGIIEAGFGYTTRWLTGDRSLRTSYLSFKPAVRISTDDATQAALFDLDKFQFADGVGIKLGVEWGRSGATKRSKVKEDIEASLAKARASCIAARRVFDPWAKPVADEAAADRSQQLSLRSGNDLLQLCMGTNLLAWLKNDASASWASIVKPVWGYEAKPVFYVGLEGSIAWSEQSYYPLRDTNTGQLTGNTLPADFLDKKGATTLETAPFALSGYLGGSWPINVPFFSGDNGKDDAKGRAGLAGSMTYRRTFEFPKSVKDQTVCAQVVASNFDQCRTVNIGAPLEREGFVAAAALKFEMPRIAFLPAIGFTIRPTYAFDIGQLGLEVPIFFLSGSDGKLNSGIKLTCTDDARTKSGFQVEGECGAALFFGSTFSLSGTP